MKSNVWVRHTWIALALLALCVLDADSLPLWTQDQWQAFGARHPAQAVELFNAAWRLSGFDEAAQAKN